MTTSTPPLAISRVGYFRWVICGLLFLAATLNYIDRQVIGILKPTLQQEFGWSEMDYADIVFAFQVAYAIGLLFAGRLMDRLGTRLGFALAIVIWSLAAMAHAEATWFGPGVAAMLSAVGWSTSGRCRGSSRRALRARPRRGRELPGVDQGRGRVVPEEGARAGDRHLQFRHQRRRARSCPSRCRGSRSPTAGTGRSSPPGPSGSSGCCSGGRCTRARSTIRGSARPNWPTSRAIRRTRRQGAAARDPAAPADVGVRRREVHDRPDLVAVPVLDPGLLQPEPTAST